METGSVDRALHGRGANFCGQRLRISIRRQLHKDQTGEQARCGRLALARFGGWFSECEIDFGGRWILQSGESELFT